MTGHIHEILRDEDEKEVTTITNENEALRWAITELRYAAVETQITDEDWWECWHRAHNISKGKDPDNPFDIPRPLKPNKEAKD